jgi:glycosyltransferase involved in cell wall biosynthesis
MKILTLSTYPFSTPRHGGQHRLHSIVGAYRSAGHEVQSIGVLGSASYTAEEGFISFPPNSDLVRCIPNPFLMDDWAIGELAAHDDRYFSSLRALVPQTPDLIHVEQPWLFGFAQRYAAEVARRPILLIYGAQNVEHLLKFRIVEPYLGQTHADECTHKVLQCELAAIKGADMVCAVSEGDAAWLRQEANCDVLVAANGVHDRVVTDAGLGEANAITGHRKSALYCASAHPPNIVGFFEMFERGVGCLSPDERLVVAGSASTNIKSDGKFNRVPGLHRHYVGAGEVSDSCLQGLLSSAHVILLPITRGGGTNLKTAEALWAGRHVVATPTAMRGFEQFERAHGVKVCQDAVGFRHAVREAMSEPPLEISAADRQTRRVLLWESSLMPLVRGISELAPESNHAQQ